MISGLTNDIRIAHVIQKTLVPTEIPMISGFEFSTKFIPSSKTGGDYFDVFEHDDRSRFGVIVASSSSYSVSAILISVLLKLTSQMEAWRSSEPMRLLKNLTKHLVPQLDKSSKLDLFYGLFNRRDYKFSFYRAGEVIALRYDYGQGKLISLESTTGPIDAYYSVKNGGRDFTLQSKDRLIFCTRGIVEEKNKDGECYGKERLFETILNFILEGPHELRNEILFQIRRFNGGVEPFRDLSVVVIDVKEQVIRLA